MFILLGHNVWFRLANDPLYNGLAYTLISLAIMVIRFAKAVPRGDDDDDAAAAPSVSAADDDAPPSSSSSVPVDGLVLVLWICWRSVVVSAGYHGLVVLYSSAMIVLLLGDGCCPITHSPISAVQFSPSQKTVSSPIGCKTPGQYR